MDDLVEDIIDAFNYLKQLKTGLNLRYGLVKGSIGDEYLDCFSVDYNIHFWIDINPDSGIISINTILAYASLDKKNYICRKIFK